MRNKIHSVFAENIAVKQAMLQDDDLAKTIVEAVHLIVATFRQGGKILFCGNGGSAADAQHLAAELSGRYYLDRPALFAEALHVNTSFLTAVSNDFGFENAFARAVEAMGKRGDVLFALSTSGRSPNILRAIAMAKELELHVIGMTGAEGGDMAGLCDFLIKIPSNDTPRIQEGHLLVGHVICEQVEQTLFP